MSERHPLFRHLMCPPITDAMHCLRDSALVALGVMLTMIAVGLAPDGGDAFVRYAYDAVGNRASETRPLGTTTYTYDASDQLTAAQGPTATTSYTYDPNGNQTSAGARTYTYDLANRLTGAELTGASLAYAYDGDGRRARATRTDLLAPTTTTYTWDTSEAMPALVLERDAAGTLVRRHVHGHDLVSTTSPDPLDPLLSRTVTLHADAIGSVAAITDASGDTDWRYTYDPYGGARRVARDDVLAAENRMRFTGEMLDTETGLYHLRARQYDPATGRFLSTDPAGRAVGEPFVNAYSYVDGRPTVLVDPAGLRGQPQAQQANFSVVAGGLAAACRAAPAACATAIIGGGIIALDPFNYTETLESFGAAAWDWFAADEPTPTLSPVPSSKRLVPPLTGSDIDTQHRGRIQVQGPDMNPEVSWSWARSTPPSAAEGLMNLWRLQGSLTTRQAEVRDEAFARAADYIRRCAEVSGCGPPGPRPLQNRNLPPRLSSARVDIEILTGLAFLS